MNRREKRRLRRARRRAKKWAQVSHVKGPSDVKGPEDTLGILRLSRDVQHDLQHALMPNMCQCSSKHIQWCVMCGKALNPWIPDRVHIDTCSVRCFQRLLGVQRQFGAPGCTGRKMPVEWQPIDTDPNAEEKFSISLAQDKGECYIGIIRSTRQKISSLFPGAEFSGQRLPRSGAIAVKLPKIGDTP